MPIDVAAIRRNAWAQGSIVDPVTLSQLTIDSDGKCAVVLTQDCDLVHEGAGEPYVELCLAEIKAGDPDGNFVYGKNARNLHLPITTTVGPRFLHLAAANRVSVPREAIASCAPSKELILEPEPIQILVDWVVSRYSRDAFPDAFNSRIADALAKKIPAAMKKYGKDVVCVYAAMNSWGELVPEEAYKIHLIVVMRAASFEAKQPLADAQKLAAELARMLEISSPEGQVQVVDSKVVSEKNISLHDERFLKRLDFDYLTLRDGPTADLQPLRRR